MRPERRRPPLVVAGALLFSIWCNWSPADDIDLPDRLTLADLSTYRAALAGNSITRDAGRRESQSPVSFKQLWSHPDAFRGQRVTVAGSVRRIFRQGPVGSFPALAEVWITSPAGDPFCLVMPQKSLSSVPPTNVDNLEANASLTALPEMGRPVQFSGTFLKIIRFTAGDGARLAPLIVGDLPPVPAHTSRQPNGKYARLNSAVVPWATSAASWLLGLTLAILAAGVLAWHRFDMSSRLAVRQRERATQHISPAIDPPLEFIEPNDER